MTPNFRKLVCLLLLTYFQWGGLFHAQLKGFGFYQELQGIESQWHKIELPNHLFGKIKPDFSDIRIIGITSNNDTIEAPFLLRNNNEGPKREEFVESVINISKNKKGHYFTVVFSTPEIINEISLRFVQQNFDWRVSVEGSQDQNEWFILSENQRILSINNEETKFSYTKVRFNDSKFKYYRIHFNTQELPLIEYISLINDGLVKNKSRNYTLNNFSVKKNNQNKSTTISINTEIPLSLNSITLKVKDTIDYYRNFSIYYAVDSIKSKDGWEHNYLPLNNGTLNSIDKNSINFYPTIAQYFKIEIENKDNAPLQIDSVRGSGNIYELIIRFPEEASYFLCYGNENSLAPEYDLAYFESKIPDQLTTLQLGNLVDASAPIASEKTQQNWEINSIWLWIVMIVIILTLGWFSFNMIKKME